MVGIPQPLFFLRASAAASITAGLVPSPVKAAIPACSQAEDILINEDQAILPFYYYVSQNMIDTNKWGGWYPNTMDYHPTKDIYLK